MEFFGNGYSNPIKDMMRSDYKEPDTPPKNAFEVENKSGQNFSERIKELDCYIGFTDGYAYRSWDRLTRMRTKYVWKPVGPTDMYRYAGATSMEHGWWISDPDLVGEWYRPRTIRNITTSEISRYISHCLKVDKHYKW
ncbi:hypothetical protein JTB14_028840 [Gonioctena quinquepunctata]|nr:hypothetical protein JTB14_028840 [Gonioctena quinquepunctata]